jgi:hypothetical protein
MVYYPVSDAKLYEEIETEKPGWLITARQRRDDNVNGQALVWKDSIWSDIKPVFMRRQADKCVYCEFPLGGRSTQDVEHYRPKSRISVWPTGGTALYEFTTGGAVSNGYYWLAYDPMNYAASCKDCNSALKRDAFPILSNRGAAPLTVLKLNQDEKPLLLFPFGDWGDDPAEYFVFDGIFVRPKSGLEMEKQKRARVTIDFFRLNSRHNLLRARYTVLGLIWANVELRQTSTSAATVARAERTILQNIIPEAPHTLCARSFHELMKSNPARAVELHEEALTILKGLGYFKIAGP